MRPLFCSWLELAFNRDSLLSEHEKMKVNFKMEDRDKDWIDIGRVTSVHGVKGALYIISHFEHSEDIFEHSEHLCFGEEKQHVSMRFLHRKKNGFVVKIAEIENRESAQALVGQSFYILSRHLPEKAEDEYYYNELIGFDVVSLEAVKLGKLKSIENFGAGDLLLLSLKEAIKGYGKEVFLPFEENFVPEIDVAKRQIFVNIDKWLSGQEIVPAGDEFVRVDEDVMKMKS